jgi:hypothetical protein
MSSNPSLESEVQKELEQLLDEFIAGLNRLRQRITATAAPPHPELPAAPRFRILPEQTAVPSQIIAPPSLITPEQFNRFIGEYLSAGVIERPFSGHDFFVAAEELNNTGAQTDLGRTVDFVMVSPTIDAQIDFDRDIKATTPVVTGGTIFRWNLRVRTIHHKAVSTTLTGQLYVWVAWY